jgi:hypothetical protein
MNIGASEPIKAAYDSVVLAEPAEAAAAELLKN